MYARCQVDGGMSGQAILDLAGPVQIIINDEDAQGDRRCGRTGLACLPQRITIVRGSS